MRAPLLTRSLTAAVFGALILAGAGAGAAAKADSPLGSRSYSFGWVHVSPSHHRKLGPRRVTRLLKRNGYRHVHKLRYLEHRDLYVAKGRTYRGRKFRVFVNPWNGRIFHARSHHKRVRTLSRDDVIRRLQWAGYFNISGPKYRDGIYVARVDDRFGYRRLVHVDPYSGVIRHVRTRHRRHRHWDD
ncbi:MAG: hypothetical protein QNJ92_00815 [Alphaproteobacteria bacterium]|nr:hypothetical protein [Alphaproteobacteria bacterium]